MGQEGLTLLTSTPAERAQFAQQVNPNTPDGMEACDFLHCRMHHRDVVGKDGVGVVRVHVKDPVLAGFLRMHGNEVIFLRPDDPEPERLHPAYRKVYFID